MPKAGASHASPQGRPCSSPPRDTPEQNPGQSLTGGFENWVKGFRSMAIDRDSGESFMSKVRESASSVLELTRQWKEYSKEMELTEESVRKHALELQKKEERLRTVEEREKKIDLLEVSIVERLGVLHEKEEDSDVRQSVGANLMILVLERQTEELVAQLKAQEKSLKDCMIKKHEELKRELEVRKEELEVRQKELSLLDETIKEKSNEIEKREEKFQLKQDAEARELEVKSKSLERNEKKLEELMRELEVRKEELEARQKELSLLDETIKEKYTELEKREEKLQLKQDTKAREIEAKSKSFELKEKKHEELARELQARKEELEARQKELIFLDETMKEKLTELEKREEQFQLKQKAEAREIEVKRKYLKLMEKRPEESEKEFVGKQKDLDERPKQAENSKRSWLEYEPSVLPEKGRDAGSLIHPGKKHKQHNHDDGEKETEAYAIVCVDDEDPQPYICPDPDFNEFNRSFAVGQVWALYDPIDRMPRYYAQIRRILKPQLSVEVTWLESVQNTEDEEPIPVACGEFRYGYSEIQSQLTLSHEMHHIKSGKNVTVIYPRKGETWALFRDWTKTWISHREQLGPPYRYDFVEVEFENDQGVAVAYLGRVEGFTSVYKHAEQHGIIKMMISSDEMLRFSHRVPSFKLTGDEKEGVPAGSFELDPAAIPWAMVKEEKIRP